MKYVSKLLFLVACISLITGCNDRSSEEMNLPALTQSFEHADYSVKLPETWTVARDNEMNPTLVFSSNEKSIGGLYLARYDSLDELPADREEITQLKGSTYQVYRYDTDAEFVICFYVPERNSGYELVFNSKEVSEKLAYAIAETMVIK